MTLQDLRQLDTEFVHAADIAPILRVDPQCIRRQARIDPKALGFPVSVLGTRCKIPRIPFLQFVEGRYEKE